MENRLYVLVRKDLSESQQAVQAGHAVAEFLLNNPKTDWRNGTLIYLGVSGESDLWKWKDRLGDGCIEFREPDIGNQITALAVAGDKAKFRRLELL